MRHLPRVTSPLPPVGWRWLTAISLVSEARSTSRCRRTTVPFPLDSFDKRHSADAARCRLIIAQPQQLVGAATLGDSLAYLKCAPV